MTDRETRTPDGKDKKDKKTEPRARGLGRRALLTGIGAGGVSAAAAAMAGSGPAADSQAVPAKTGSNTEPVYRETEHIRAFYARSRF